MNALLKRTAVSIICALLFFCCIQLYGQETIRQLKEKIIDIQNRGQLGFRNFMLCSNIIGYGQYVPDLLYFNYQTRSPVFDVHASNSLELGNLPPGTYIFKAVMHDKLKNENATYTYKFEVIK